MREIRSFGSVGEPVGNCRLYPEASASSRRRLRNFDTLLESGPVAGLRAIAVHLIQSFNIFITIPDAVLVSSLPMTASRTQNARGRGPRLS